MQCYNGDTPEEFNSTDIPSWEAVLTKGGDVRTNPLGLTEFYQGEIPPWSEELGEFQWEV